MTASTTPSGSERASASEVASQTARKRASLSRRAAASRCARSSRSRRSRSARVRSVMSRPMLAAPDDRPGLVADGRDADRDVEARAVLAHAHRLVVVDAFAAAQPRHDGRQFVRAVRRDDQRDRLADRLGRRVAIEALGGPVPAGDRALEGLADDGVVGGLHDRRQEAVGRDGGTGQHGASGIGGQRARLRHGWTEPWGAPRHGRERMGKSACPRSPFRCFVLVGLAPTRQRTALPLVRPAGAEIRRRRGERCAGGTERGVARSVVPGLSRGRWRGAGR